MTRVIEFLCVTQMNIGDSAKITDKFDTLKLVWGGR